MSLPRKPYAVLAEPHPVPTGIIASDILPNSVSVIQRPKVLLVDDNDNDLFLTRKSLVTQNCDVAYV